MRLNSSLNIFRVSSAMLAGAFVHCLQQAHPLILRGSRCVRNNQQHEHVVTFSIAASLLGGRWSEEESKLAMKLRGEGMQVVDIARHLPGRTCTAVWGRIARELRSSRSLARKDRNVFTQYEIDLVREHYSLGYTAKESAEKLRRPRASVPKYRVFYGLPSITAPGLSHGKRLP
jgi:hypothetical protein